ncbi:nucleotidyl transferase AbiEii/AbiGii toxin family protein [Fusibacter bizertensis]
MIDKKTFTREWIEDRSNHFKTGKSKGNSELIEKVINALYLLEKLVSSGINMIFKGGTSLVLLLDEVHRFSIDIDIILQNDNGLDALLDAIISDNYIFQRYEKNERKNTKGIPKAHYKFYFTSILDNTEKYILLDILFEENPYDELITQPIESAFLLSSGDAINVVMPSINCILGDKLTAFAPKTTGIPYGADKELEIIKQLFDVNNLFDHISNLDHVRQTFNRIAQNELNYRGLTDVTIQDVLNDIYDTSFVIAMRGAHMEEEFKQLELGVKRVKSHIFSKNFIIEDALLCASKAAYCAVLMMRDDRVIEKFDASIDLSKDKIEIDGFTKHFNTIKKITPEGFFYWKKAVELKNNK